MSRAKAIKPTSSEAEEKPQLALVETGDNELPVPLDNENHVDGADEVLEAAPADLVVYMDSLGVSMLDRYSLVRVFREEWRSKVAFYR